MRLVLALLGALLGLFAAAPAGAQSLEYFSLNMAWLPGQCLVEPEIPACAGLSFKDPRGRNLILLGLKPESRPGATAMRDCDPIARAFTAPAMDPGDTVTACSLPAIKLSDDLRAALDALTADPASCQERAFWARHGSCALLSPQRFFERAVGRAEDLQRSLLNFAIASAVGKRVVRSDLQMAFEEQFGPQSARSLQLICQRSKQYRQPVLVQVQVTLSQTGSMRALSGEGLWFRAAGAAPERCPAEFLIAEPGQPEPPLPEKPLFPTP